MNEETLHKLLKQPEGPTLEFKQEIKIYLTGEAEKREKDELLKDLLALANGNSTVAGENKFLIFGASNKFTPGTSRETFDIGNQYPTCRDLLNMLKAVSNPFLDRLEADIVTIDGNRLLVITIPPTRYLLETTRRLKASKRDFDEYTVFFRQDEEAIPASASVRDAIRRAKEKYFNERNDVPPKEFGALVGAVISILIIVAQLRRNDFPLSSQIIGGVLALVIGAFMGWGLGYMYVSIRYIRDELALFPRWAQIIFAIASVPYLLAWNWIVQAAFRLVQSLLSNFTGS